MENDVKAIKITKDGISCNFKGFEFNYSYVLGNLRQRRYEYYYEKDGEKEYLKLGERERKGSAVGLARLAIQVFEKELGKLDTEERHKLKTHGYIEDYYGIWTEEEINAKPNGTEKADKRPNFDKNDFLKYKRKGEDAYYYFYNYGLYDSLILCKELMKELQDDGEIVIEFDGEADMDSFDSYKEPKDCDKSGEESRNEISDESDGEADSNNLVKREESKDVDKNGNESCDETSEKSNIKDSDNIKTDGEGKGKVVWHYTKLGALEKIFPRSGSNDHRCGKIKLRLTNIRFLNDKFEGLALKEFFEYKDKILKFFEKEEKEGKISEEFLKKLKKIIFDKSIISNILDNTYIFSASQLQNSFAFWNKEYAGPDGIAIGIKLGMDDISFKKVNYLDYFTKDQLITKIANDSEFKKWIEKFDDKKKINDIPIYKHDSWEYEKEMRIVKIVQDAKVEFYDNKIKKTSYEYFDKSVVDSIILGPECKEEQRKAVENYLMENGYSNDSKNEDDPDYISVKRNPAFELPE